ncbi:enoyl-CoA hydratase [Desulfosarcina ovata subsp. sediminis]|uniref:Enoyl-CoA hydratase n=1 Tax=Desulfosarcina ovata subsp. sediminis TaxID=885957 RepID=A0A5K7ZI28_9BACT|nr:enoyl-CoA hydratase/isomerase family protein [Desulfosarcina ovata]BBO81004.1 enoyl-CoA hydratase [Desulfosarcina ovata subsp. sediminis]
MRYETIDVSVDDGLAYLVLNQPDRGNPYNADFCKEMGHAIDWMAVRDDIRAILISARGPHFCVGGDVEMFAENQAKLPVSILGWTRNIHVALARLWRLDAPIVTAVHATAMGGAMGLIAGSDIVYCASGAKLGAAYASIGFSCDVGVSHALVSRMGMARARRFLLLNEVMTAETAQNAGLVDFVAPDDRVFVEAEKMAKQLSQGPTRALGQIRRLMLTVWRQPVESQLEDEARGLSRVAATADAGEGIRAFLNRQRPIFKGN